MEFADFFDGVLCEGVEGVVIVRLKGHCHSCPHAMQTLKQGIEQALKRVIPEVKSVEKI